jgi:glycosyltransferase involved in cell wall biosynthesis
MKIALVHDWLVRMRGGEKCLEVFCELFPNADLFTLFYQPDRIAPAIRRMRVRASWLNRLYGIEKYYRYCLPVFPAVIERLDLNGYDLVFTSSHCVAKGAHSRGALHVAYIHSPMRYVWDMHDAYTAGERAFLPKIGMSIFRRYLQNWDLHSSEGVDHFIAGSSNIAGKIQKLYGREAAVIYPPVDTKTFFVRRRQEHFYLIVSALVPYKRIDIAVAAFNQLKLPLIIAGDGPLRKNLENSAGRNIEFLGWVDDARLAELYGTCRALIFPGEEDFGIVPLEAQASGRPVIGYGKGGLLETVIPLDACEGGSGGQFGPTGIFFPEQTSDSVITAVELFERAKDAFDPAKIRLHTAGFSRERFKAQVKEFVETRIKEWRG